MPYTRHMATAQRIRIPAPPVSMDGAADNLRFIRDTMERAAAFTAVPGWGGVVIGATALIAGLFAAGMPLERQFSVWVTEGIVAMVLGVIAVRWKSRRISISLFSQPARRALLSFAPPLIAGALLSVVLYRVDELRFSPACGSCYMELRLSPAAHFLSVSFPSWAYVSCCSARFVCLLRRVGEMHS